jgi:xanthine permease XanP
VFKYNKPYWGYIKWELFIIITLGFGSFYAIKRILQWQMSHVHFEDNNEKVSDFDASAWGLYGWTLLASFSLYFLFIPFIFLYLITTIESIGDLTATSAVSGEPIEGATYIRRIKGGVLGDGVNSLIAAVFNTFPNTTFSQNNGVIQLTGVGSRYIGFFIAGILVILGLLPIVGGIFQAMPQPVLGGATIIMFGSIAFAGIKILASVALDRRALMIVALSLSLGLGVTFEPGILNGTPDIIKNIFSSGISTGGLSAILLNLLLPRND